MFECHCCEWWIRAVLLLYILALSSHSLLSFSFFIFLLTHLFFTKEICVLYLSQIRKLYSIS